MIEFVDILHANDLDSFVVRHRNCHFMQTSAYGRFRNDRLWTGIICRDDNNLTVGTMALLRITSRRLKGCMLYAPREPFFEHGDLNTFRELIRDAQQLARNVALI